MAVIGCYSMDLYCDVGGQPYGTTCPQHVPGIQNMSDFTGHTEADCIRQARDAGWRFNRDKTKATCPACAKAGRKP